MMNVAGIVNDSIVDGPGIRLVIFLQGCVHNCPGCHNPNTHPIGDGKYIENENIIKMINSNILLDGITISGGEPLLQYPELKIFLSALKSSTSKPINIWLYTGFIWEEIMINDECRDLLRDVDVIVDGRYDKSLKSNERWKGSSNQRIIDVKKSLDDKNIILWNQ